VSKKFFSLIKGGGVHVAPKTHVIPASAFSQLMEASEVLRIVQEDADQYRIEVAKECEQLKEMAQREGFEAGFKQWAEQIAVLEKEIQQVRADFERVIVPVALKAAKKIVGREIELSDETIVDIVSNSLKAVSQHKKVIIYVNRKDLDPLEKSRPKLRKVFESLEALSVRERSDISPGGCIIETEGGIINAQMENQWRVLENALEFLFKRKETTQNTPKY
jgi:type III secretion protein L